jgi:hypothetical protein
MKKPMAAPLHGPKGPKAPGAPPIAALAVDPFNVAPQPEGAVVPPAAVEPKDKNKETKPKKDKKTRRTRRK